MAALFPPGHTVATPGALAALTNARTSPVDLLDRHVSGDWGDVDADEAAENELSVREGFRILSAYTLSTGERLCGSSRSTTGATPRFSCRANINEHCGPISGPGSAGSSECR